MILASQKFLDKIIAVFLHDFVLHNKD